MMYVAHTRAAYAISDTQTSVGCFAGLAIQLYQEKLYTYVSILILHFFHRTKHFPIPENMRRSAAQKLVCSVPA